MMDEIYLPALNSLMNGNVFTGSSGKLRFKLTPILQTLPSRDVDLENSKIKAEYWHGQFCYEKSQMEGEKEFSLSDDGLRRLQAWLQEMK